MKKSGLLVKNKQKQLKVIIVIILIFSLFSVIFIRWQGAKDCTSIEKYDYVAAQCYFECDSDQQCEKLSKQVDAELSQSLVQAETKTGSNNQAATQVLETGSLYNAKSTGSETKGTVYTVTEQGLQPTPSKDHENIWSLVTKLIGDDTTQKRLLSFEVFDDANNDTAAAVWRSDNPAKWHMSVNQAFASQDKKDLIRTIVHEYGHILTLSDNQVGGVRGVCPRLQLSEGCATSESYINDYYNLFWQNYGLSAGQAGELSESDAADLYTNNPRSFVSKYASTNITEDIAESFADFVVKPKPSGTTVGEQKVQYFYKHLELESLRERIRAAAAKILL